MVFKILVFSEIVLKISIIFLTAYPVWGHIHGVYPSVTANTQEVVYLGSH